MVMLRSFLTRVLVIAFPVIEIVLIIWVGNTLGWGWTGLILAACVVVGLLVMRAAGRDAFGAVMRPMERHQPFVEIDETTGTARTVHPAPQPTKDEVDEATRQLRRSGWLFMAGVLIAVPGFISTALGLLLLLPPVRAIAAKRAPTPPGRSRVVIVGETVDGAASTPSAYDPESSGQSGGTVIRGEILPGPNE